MNTARVISLLIIEHDRIFRCSIYSNKFFSSPTSTSATLISSFLLVVILAVKKTRDSYSLENVMSTLQMSFAIHEKRERKNRSTYKFCCFLFDEIEQQKTSTTILDVSYVSVVFFWITFFQKKLFFRIIVSYSFYEKIFMICSFQII
jgi:hypothetical protein